jgi:hypothetical protein
MRCPNCQTSVQAGAQQCANCTADFGPGSSWRPIPDGIDIKRQTITLVDPVVLKQTKRLRSFIFIAALALFIFSLTQPVWRCEKGGTPLDGISVLLSGFMGLLFFNPAWFCNAAMFFALVSALSPTRFGPTWIPYVASGIAATTLIGPYLCAARGGPLTDGTGLDSGALSWVLAIWLASASILLARPHQVLSGSRSNWNDA